MKLDARTPKMKIKLNHIEGVHFSLEFDSPRLPTNKLTPLKKEFKASNGITIIADMSPEVCKTLNEVYIHAGGFENKCKFHATKEFIFKMFNALDEFANNDFGWD